MKKVFLTALFFLCTTALFAAPHATVTQPEFDLGALAEGEVYSHSFAIKNSGDSPLKVDVIRVSCGCVKITTPTKETVVAPGGELEVAFAIDTTGFSGEITKFIYATTNDKMNPVMSIKITADVQSQQQAFLQRFAKFSGWTVVGAGLVDGINPCAFTVLVFFLSFLTFTGYRRNQVAILGSAFIVVVFLTYLGIGLGIFEFVRRLAVFFLISRALYLATAVLAIILGIYSLYDWWIFQRTGDPEKVKLKLPAFVKKQIHAVIREQTGGHETVQYRGVGRLIFAAVSCGFVVSLLESVCTGQLYLPTIIYVLGIPELKIKAWAYLFLYNLMFILPLIIIFLCGLFGVTSAGFARIAQLHLAKVKFITAVVFFGLGLFLLLVVR